MAYIELQKGAGNDANGDVLRNWIQNIGDLDRNLQF